MANVTMVIVIASSRDRDTTEDLVCHQDDEGQWRGWFRSASRGDAAFLWAGDSKGAECEVWVSSIKETTMKPPEIVSMLDALPWRLPAYVQVLIKPQDDARFAVWISDGGALTQVA